MALVILGAIYFFITARLPGLRLLTGAMILEFVVLFLAVNGTKDFLKKQKVSRRKNQAATIAVDVLLAVVLMAGISYGTITLARNGGFSLAADIEPLLTIADLTGRRIPVYRPQPCGVFGVSEGPGVYGAVPSRGERPPAGAAQ